MKNWLIKWRISNALDQRTTLPQKALRAMARSVELQRFAGNAAAVDAALRKGPPAGAGPDDLHDRIMRAIQSAETVQALPHREFRARLVPLAALGSLVLLGIATAVYCSRPNAGAPLPGGTSSLTIASTTLETGGEWITTAPGAALSPLSEEMSRLDHDLEGVQEHLLASVP